MINNFYCGGYGRLPPQWNKTRSAITTFRARCFQYQASAVFVEDPLDSGHDANLLFFRFSSRSFTIHELHRSNSTHQQGPQGLIQALSSVQPHIRHLLFFWAFAMSEVILSLLCAVYMLQLSHWRYFLVREVSAYRLRM